MATKSEAAGCAVPTGDPTKVLYGMKTIFEGMQMMLDGIIEQTELAGDPEWPVDGSVSVENKEQESKAAPMTETEPQQTETEDGPENEAQPEKTETAASPDTEEDDVLPFDEPPTGSSQSAQEDPSANSEHDAITLDTLTKVVVAKIKKDRGNSNRINQLVNSFGVGQLSSLPTDKYEAFLSGLSDL